MENFEKIEEFVTGKMSAGENEAFEQSMQADPTLKSEVAMQKAIVEAVQKARMAELKGILSQVPITGVEATLGISVTKIAAAIITAGALVTASIYYINQKEHKTQVKTVKDSILEKVEIPTSSIPALVPKDDSVESESAKEVRPASEKKKTTAKSKASEQPKSVSQPKIDAFQPSEESAKQSASSTESESKAAIATSHIPVETNEPTKKYSFHYQFSDDKLILFGTFDKGLYEVLEVNGNTHSVFLYYKDNFYKLNEKQKQIVPLRPITDSQLIGKLKEYRSR